MKNIITKTTTIVALALLIIASLSTLHASQAKPDPEFYAKTTYDRLVWGCRLINCSHKNKEVIVKKELEKIDGVPTKEQILAACEKGRFTPFESTLIYEYMVWFNKDGKRIQEEWRNGTHNAANDKYLPLVKTAFWNSIYNTWRSDKKKRVRDGSGRYFRGSKLPKVEVDGEEDLQNLLESGLKVLHKIYNHKELTDADKETLIEWRYAYFSSHYIGGITPLFLPGDSWKTFKKNLVGLEPHWGMPQVQKNKYATNCKPGDKTVNFKLLKIEEIINKKDFSLNRRFDDTDCLRPETIDEFIDDLKKYAENYESTDEYPIVKIKNLSNDTKETKEFTTFYNLLDNKPMIFGNWLINNDEANRRITKMLHLYYRVWNDKLNIVGAESGFLALVEKNHLKFDLDINSRVNYVLKDSVFALPTMPTPYLFAGRSLVSSGRYSIIAPDGTIMGYWTDRKNSMQPRKGDSWDGVIGTHLGTDRYLINCFKNNFSKDLISNHIPHGAFVSKFGKSLDGASENGYKTKKSYNRYGNLYEIIGEVINVDAQNHTLTILREEFHKESYPNFHLMEKFNYKASPKGDIQYKLFKSFEKAGNSIEARTIIIPVNTNVFTFLNGLEIKDETGFKKGDIISVMQQPKIKFPYILRAIRFNFAPTIDPVKEIKLKSDAGEQTIELTGISDNNLIANQSITITAESLNPALIANPAVHYTNGKQTAQLVFTPINGQTGEAEIKVTVKDNGSTFDGGKDTTTLIIKITIK